MGSLLVSDMSPIISDFFLHCPQPKKSLLSFSFFFIEKNWLTSLLRSQGTSSRLRIRIRIRTRTVRYISNMGTHIYS